MAPSNKLAIFYDSGCRVCAWEVEKYLAMDRDRRLETIDILSPEFRAGDFGLDPARVRKLFHVRTPDGRVIAGVDAFIEIWKTLGSRWSTRASRWAKIAPVHAALELGYRVFVEIRPFLPRRPGAPDCHGGSCEIR